MQASIRLSSSSRESIAARSILLLWSTSLGSSKTIKPQAFLQYEVCLVNVHSMKLANPSDLQFLQLFT